MMTVREKSEFETLQRKVEELTKEMNRLREAPPSDTSYTSPLQFDPMAKQVPLPNSCNVRFKVGDAWVQCRVEERRGKKHLYVMGERQFIIQPCVANAVEIHIIE